MSNMDPDLLEEEEDEDNGKMETVPFPTSQMFVLALCRITEPIAFCSIFPYVYYMVLSFNVTDDERRVAVYCGMITSIFAFSEFATGMLWGKLSDKIGRKPVLMVGLFGTGLSQLLFGLAPNLWVALLARAVGGALNGNVGVLQTTVTELVTREQQPFAFSIMPFVWCVGAVVGSCLGGLAEPVRNYPGTFRPGTIWDQYPFLLPNIIAAVVVVFGILNGILFLEETHEKRKGQKDYGLEVGRWMTSKGKNLWSRLSSKNKEPDVSEGEREPLMRDRDAPSYDGQPSTEDVGKNNSSSDADIISTPSGKVRKTFNSQVIIQIVAYGILAYHTIAFEQLLPVFLSMDEVYDPPESFLKFTGGFGLPVSTIGAILGAQGFYQMFFQILFFAPIIHKVGSLRTYRFIAITYPLLYFVVPYLVLLPKGAPRFIGLSIVLVVKITYGALAYPANALLLTNATPSLLVLGTVNGVAASCASLCRAFGPTLSGVIQAVGLDTGYGGLPWWSSALVCVIGGIQTLWMTDEIVADEDEDEDDDEDKMSAIFRRGSVARINVSNNTESSIAESQFLAAVARRGSVVSTVRRMSVSTVRRMSVSTARGSIAGNTLSRQTSRQARRERSLSHVGGN